MKKLFVICLSVIALSAGAQSITVNDTINVKGFQSKTGYLKITEMEAKGNNIVVTVQTYANDKETESVSTEKFYFSKGKKPVDDALKALYTAILNDIVNQKYGGTQGGKIIPNPEGIGGK
jgi:hypothetical protein